MLESSPGVARTRRKSPETMDCGGPGNDFADGELLQGRFRFVDRGLEPRLLASVSRWKPSDCRIPIGERRGLELDSRLCQGNSPAGSQQCYGYRARGSR